MSFLAAVGLNPVLYDVKDSIDFFVPYQRQIRILATRGSILVISPAVTFGPFFGSAS